MDRAGEEGTGILAAPASGFARWTPGSAIVLALIAALPLNKLYWDVGVRVRPWYLLAPIALVVAARSARMAAVSRPMRSAIFGMWLVAVSGIATGMWAIDRSAWVNNAGDLGLGVAAALAIALAGLGPGRARRLVTWWIVVGVAMSVYGLLQYAAHQLFSVDLDAYTVGRASTGLRRSGIDIYAGYPRINSLIEDSSNYSIYLLTVWPLLLFRSLWGSASHAARIRNLVGLALVVANLVLTLSRSGLVGAFVGAALTVVLVPAIAEVDRRRAKGARRTMTAAPARLAAAVTGVALLGAFMVRGALARIVDLRTQNSEGTQIHLATLKDSVQLMSSEPWGVGLGGFPRWYQLHRVPWEPAQTSTFNSFTDAGTSAGVLALIGYLTVLVSLGRGLWIRAFRLGPGGADAAGGLVALVSVAVAAFFYPAFAAGYFVGFVGLLIAVASAPEPGGDA